MDELIPILNKLQEVFNIVGTNVIELPQIVVVGSQSSGKSSVLESLVGRDFLPRGSGIVTRRPLVLQLVGVDEDGLKKARNDNATLCDFVEWAVFEHCPDTIFTDFNEVREEIISETDKLTGTNKNISDVPIILKIFSIHAITLSLVDLPGITKIPVGDQPPDIENRILEMVMHYIKNPNSIILAVSAANVDIATAEALQIAKIVDPDGIRTLAVLTKLDIMDHGTDALDVLCGNVIRVKLGIIGVVNRSQLDIKNNKPITESLSDEKDFLMRRYPSIAENHGTDYLARTLNKLLLHHIKDCLPSLRNRVITMLTQFQNTIHILGDPIGSNDRFLLNVINIFSTAFCSSIEGNSKVIITSELTGGARICYIFHEMFGRALESVDPIGGLSELDILTAIRNSTGPRPALFVSETSFESLVRRQIKRLEEPSLKCVHLVHDELQRIVQFCDIKQFAKRFPRLYMRIVDVVTSLLRDRLPATIKMVQDIINIELAYINTKHPDFHAAKTLYKCVTTGEVDVQCALRSLTNLNLLNENQENLSNENEWEQNNNDRQHEEKQNDEHVMSTREKKECQIIEHLIKSYFEIVRKSIQDLVPKAIMHFLVNSAKDGMQSELVQSLYKPGESINQLLVECPQAASKRRNTEKMLAALEKASEIISDIRESPISSRGTLPRSVPRNFFRRNFLCGLCSAKRVAELTHYVDKTQLALVCLRNEMKELRTSFNLLSTNISSESNAKSSRNFTTSPFFAQVLRPAVTRSVLATSQINKDASPLKILKEAEIDSRRPANVIIRDLPISEAEENKTRKMNSLIGVEVGHAP
ncbi:hypothetical protein GJ496_011594 [Pomphorhynchus laevis]|nr:hypothetical protein GJ496_011594 [Pomphorhynchus laevis]